MWKLEMVEMKKQMLRDIKFFCNRTKCVVFLDNIVCLKFHSDGHFAVLS
jgi:hypothetical protein